MTFKTSENVAIVATIDPDANTTGALSTDYIDMQKFESALAIVMAGIIVTSGTVDFKLQQATSTTGGGLKDITGLAITQLSTTSNDKQAAINVHVSDLDTAGGFRYVKGVMTVTTAGADAAAIIIADNPRRGPANENDLASVAEIIS